MLKLKGHGGMHVTIGLTLGSGANPLRMPKKMPMVTAMKIKVPQKNGMIELKTVMEDTLSRVYCQRLIALRTGEKLPQLQLQ